MHTCQSPHLERPLENTKSSETCSPPDTTALPEHRAENDFRVRGAVLRRILCGEPASASPPHRASSLHARPFGAAPAAYPARGGAAPDEPYRAGVGEPCRAGARSPAARPPTSAALPAAAAASGLAAAAAAAAAATAALGSDWGRLSARLALLQQQVRARHQRL